MPRKAKKEKIPCLHFTWLLGRRGETWTADGRSNPVDLGRHSLGTKDRDEALRQLAALDLGMAVEHGYADASALKEDDAEPLPLEEGKEHYLAFAGRPRIAKGVRRPSLRKYKNVLRKFVAFARGRGLKTWNQVRDETLHDYAAELEAKGYSLRTASFELTTLLQAAKWLTKAGHLPAGFKLRSRSRSRTGPTPTASPGRRSSRCGTTAWPPQDSGGSGWLSGPWP
ncbi:MAG TPA: site-specific integrase [Planctomycetaceae bacterium]